MKTFTLDLDPGDKDSMFLVLPTHLVGEVGEAFSEDFKRFLSYLSLAGYWPVDFGEGDNSHQMLWLKRDTVEVAIKQTAHFISVGGDV